MYSLTIAVGTHSWRLLYRDKDKVGCACALLDTHTQNGWKLEDDFGQIVVIGAGHLCGFVLEDLDKSKMGMVEMALHQARTQKAATNAAQADPGLRTGMPGQISAILNPMGNGGARF